jgi:hypothetical protein
MGGVRCCGVHVPRPVTIGVVIRFLLLTFPPHFPSWGATRSSELARSKDDVGQELQHHLRKQLARPASVRTAAESRLLQLASENHHHFPLPLNDDVRRQPSSDCTRSGGFLTRSGGSSEHALSDRRRYC